MSSSSAAFSASSAPSQPASPPAVFGQRAVVVGASIIGLLSARVLSDYFTEVLVLDKDDIKDDTTDGGSLFPSRKAVPQGNHIHILLSGGSRIICDLFPGIDRDFVAAGARDIDFARDIRWYLNGRWFPREEIGLRTFIQTRPLLETVLRRRVREIPNIRFAFNHRVTDYRLSENGRAVVGVIVSTDRSQSTVIASDYVVDCGGRGAFLPRWLGQAGFGAPRETHIGIDLAYATTYFHRPPGLDRDWMLMACHPNPPHQKKGGVLCAVEGNRWLLTLAGYHKDHPPADEEGFKAFTAALPIREIYEEIKTLPLLEPIKTHKFPSGMRRHFESMQTLPDGILGVGDVIGSLNPAFGQGISNGALQIEVLRKELRKRIQQKHLNGLQHAFYQGAAKAITPAWNMANGENLKYPETHGRRPFFFPLMRWYSDRIIQSKDPVVSRQFFKVMHLVAPPSTLMMPDIMRRVLLPSSGAAAGRLTPPQPEPRLEI